MKADIMVSGNELDVLGVVAKHGSPSLAEIKEELDSLSGVGIIVSGLVDRGFLRMKEDEVEHEWTYRINKDRQDSKATT